MDVVRNLRPICAWGLCARVMVAFCLLVFGVGDAVERSLSGHFSLEAAMSYAVSAEQIADLSTDHSGVHVDDHAGDVDPGAQVVGHGCHACAALPEPMSQMAAARAAALSPARWTSTPSTVGREPLVDLPPPRA